MTTKVIDSVSLLEGLDSYLAKLSASEYAWLCARRAQARDRYIAVGLPTMQDEDWRFTGLDPLLRQSYRVGTPAVSPAKGVIPADYCRRQEFNLVFVDGVFMAEWSSSQPPPGTRICSLRQVLKDGGNLEPDVSRYHVAESSAFIALNEALWYDGALIDLPANTVVPTVVHVVHLATGEAANKLISPRTIIRVGASSECTVLESHLSLSLGTVYFANALTDIWLGENATVHYCKAQAESLAAVHIGATRVWQERNSNFDGFSLSTGADLARHDLAVFLDGEGAGARLNGLYAVNGKQHVDNHTAVEHRVPNATSNQLYKGVLNGQARAVFNGKVFVRPVAQGTNSYQLNKNLVMGAECRVDTKPQLEIFADDVKCTHGATIGQLDEDEIFYLQTRAIAPRDAVRMLARGFVDDILSVVHDPEVRSRLNLLLQPTFTGF